MTDINLLQAQYEIGNDRAVVTALEEDEVINVNLTFDQICKSLDALAAYLSPANEKTDPENYAFLKDLAGVDLDTAKMRDYYEAGVEIKISPETIVRAGQWNDGAISTDELDLLKERVAAFNEGKIYTVDFYEIPAHGEGYFTNYREIAEFLAETYMLSRSDDYYEKEDENQAGRAGDDDRGLY